MLLAIDAGNTNIVFALYDGERRVGLWRCATDARRTADEYAVWLSQLMAHEQIAFKAVNEAVIASVVPDATFNLTGLCVDHFKADPVIVGDPEVILGIGVEVDRPEEVGADRLVNGVAAVRTYGAPLIIVDFGTATTFDVINERGNYAGGVIAPGINLSMEALHMAAAKLPRVEVRKVDTVIGRSTVRAMQSGIYWGYVGLIEGLLTRIKAEFGQPMTVIATGGLAVLFAEATSAIEHIDSDLTLRGLVHINHLNRES